MGIFSVSHVEGLCNQWRRSHQIVFPLLGLPACLPDSSTDRLTATDDGAPAAAAALAGAGGGRGCAS